MTENKDFRILLLDNILINTEIIDTLGGKYEITDKLEQLNQYLDIVEFKILFNNMLIGLGHLGYTMYDLLKFYATGNSRPDNSRNRTYGSEIESINWSDTHFLASNWEMKNVNSSINIQRNIVSTFILDMIIEAIDSRFNPDKDTYQPTFTASNYLKENNKVPYIPSSDNFIKFFKLNRDSIIGKDISNAINTLELENKITSEYLAIFISLKDDLKIFDLYDRIVDMEEDIIEYTTDSLELTYIKPLYYIQNYLVLYIIKYYVLSELLLRTLLDTQENQGITSSNTDIYKINENRETTTENKVDTDVYNKQNIININYNYDNVLNDNDVGLKLNVVNNVLSGITYDNQILTTYVYKIIKDMWLINYLLEKNSKFLLSENVIEINEQTQASSIESEIALDVLNNKVENINKNILELNLKNLNIQKQHEKKRNMYYITIALVIIFIFLNIYVIKNNKFESLLTINIIIVIVILLTKFFTLIKKSYQTLVKDLNN
jgi:hypothetical protein